MKIDGTNQHSPTNVAALCPHCGHNGTFEPVNINDVRGSHTFGVRRCPRTECLGYLFVIKQNNGIVVRTFPSLTIDFDSSDIPERVERCLKEAIECHANGNDIAAAIMVRKTLEEVCHEQKIDETNESGKKLGLKKKIELLGDKVVIPASLVKGMDNLLILGNDAAHIEAEVYSEIGKVELEVAIRFAKEILKAIYQYDSLLQELEGLGRRD